jgi:hypothetical protein
VVVNAVEFREESELSKLDRDDQRDGFREILRPRFGASGHTAGEIGVAPGDFRADLGRFVKVPAHHGSIDRLRQQLRAATKISNVVSTECKGSIAYQAVDAVFHLCVVSRAAKSGSQ